MLTETQSVNKYEQENPWICYLSTKAKNFTITKDFLPCFKLASSCIQCFKKLQYRANSDSDHGMHVMRNELKLWDILLESYEWFVS